MLERKRGQTVLGGRRPVKEERRQAYSKKVSMAVKKTRKGRKPAVQRRIGSSESLQPYVWHSCFIL